MQHLPCPALDRQLLTSQPRIFSAFKHNRLNLKSSVYFPLLVLVNVRDGGTSQTHTTLQYKMKLQKNKAGKDNKKNSSAPGQDDLYFSGWCFSTMQLKPSLPLQAVSSHGKCFSTSKLNLRASALHPFLLPPAPWTQRADSAPHGSFGDVWPLPSPLPSWLPAPNAPKLKFWSSALV